MSKQCIDSLERRRLLSTTYAVPRLDGVELETPIIVESTDRGVVSLTDVPEGAKVTIETQQASLLWVRETKEMTESVHVFDRSTIPADFVLPEGASTEPTALAPAVITSTFVRVDRTIVFSDSAIPSEPPIRVIDGDSGEVLA